MSIQKEFDAYIAASYGGKIGLNHPDPASADQYSQLRDAFFGGCLVAHTTPDDLVPELLDFAADLKKRYPGKVQ